jgi:ribosomal protein S25
MRAHRMHGILQAIARLRVATTKDVAVAAGVSVRVAWPVLRVAAKEGLVEHDRNGRDALWVDLRPVEAP